VAGTTDESWWDAALSLTFDGFTTWRIGGRGVYANFVGDLVLKNLEVAEWGIGGVDVAHAGENRPHFPVGVFNSKFIRGAANSKYVALTLPQTGGFAADTISFFEDSAGMYAIADQSHYNVKGIRSYGLNTEYLTNITFHSTEADKRFKW
jgi:hypothetical protein